MVLGIPKQTLFDASVDFPEIVIFSVDVKNNY
jgi:hypothetical protein